VNANDYKESYIPGELITIRVGKPSLEGKLKLYINDEHVSDLILIDDYYVTKFYMPTYDVDLKIVLENWYKHFYLIIVKVINATYSCSIFWLFELQNFS